MIQIFVMECRYFLPALRRWWALSPSLATELVSAALRQAVEARRPEGRDLLHHSDRGCQYTSDAYQQTLRTLGINVL